MQAIEYRTIDKSSWGRGTWQDEPDKRQWQDEATGLPCLIVRSPLGHLCGYVGVSASHPWHGKSYNSCLKGLAVRHDDGLCEGCKEHGWCQNRPENILHVHGSITYSDFSAVADRATFDRMVKRLATSRAEARQFPSGDSARFLKTWEAALSDFDQWQIRWRETAICSVIDDDKLYWFGFDCAHYGDMSPGTSGSLARGEYRDVAYVAEQCAALAKQLAVIASVQS